MNTLEECIQRVSIRVKEGGHMVSELSIEYNFKHGYENLYEYFHHFDAVTLLDNSIATDQLRHVPVKILSWETGSITLHKHDYPEWVENFIKANKSKYKKK
jgi:predicted ABC-type ATPase